VHRHLHEYFAAIGLPTDSPRRLVERMEELREQGQTHRLPDGTMLVSWRDASGSAAAILVDEDNAVVGALPYLASARPISVYVKGIEKDNYFGFFDRLRISLAPDERAPTYTVHAHDLILARDRVQVGRPLQVSLTALADQWLRPTSEPTPPPTGDPLADPAIHHLTGRITRVDDPVNRTSHLPFQHGKLDTGELILDVVVPEADPKDPATHLIPNTFVDGEFLLVATVDVAPLDATVAKIRLKR
jgi:hypothetical protein